MSEISDAVMAEAVALYLERTLTPVFAEQLAARMTEALLAELDVLDAAQARAVLGLAARTFQQKVNEERLLTKSTLLGPKHPRFSLKEILERVRATAIKRLGEKGERPQLVGLPKARAAA